MEEHFKTCLHERRVRSLTELAQENQLFIYFFTSGSQSFTC